MKSKGTFKGQGKQKSGSDFLKGGGSRCCPEDGNNCDTVDVTADMRFTVMHLILKFGSGIDTSSITVLKIGH